MGLFLRKIKCIFSWSSLSFSVLNPSKNSWVKVFATKFSTFWNYLAGKQSLHNHCISFPRETRHNQTLRRIGSDLKCHLRNSFDHTPFLSKYTLLHCCTYLGPTEFRNFPCESLASIACTHSRHTRFRNIDRTDRRRPYPADKAFASRESYLGHTPSSHMYFGPN